jgi:cap1 methyltransferase
MAAKGCAIVLLRDQQVLEKSVEMRVAVIDGVCVEVRRHTRRKEVDHDRDVGVGGVFVAWGHRVERKITVSEEGLEDYFNGLAGITWPEGLTPEPPFEECHQCFTLKSDGCLPLSLEPQVDTAGTAKLLEGPHGQPELVRGLWEAKDRLEDLWSKPPPPFARSVFQRVARDQMFPHSGKEGKEYENRAGDKLAELVEAVGLLDGVPKKAAFLDLCGGPGAWSQLLLDAGLGLQGFGLTLRSGGLDGRAASGDWQAQEKDDWYDDLVSRHDWCAVWGADGTGDLLKPGNVEHAAGEIRRRSGGVFLCLADGGFSDDAIPPNQLELYFYRLFLGELFMATSCLQPGGRFICKLYTSFSTATSALLFLTTRLFKSVQVIKPVSSKVGGPERYLVATGFHGCQGDEAKAVCAALARAHTFGAGVGNLLRTPLLTPLVSTEDLLKDSSFEAQLRTMVTTLGKRQTLALHAIRERAELLEDAALEAADLAAEPKEYIAPPPRPQPRQQPKEPKALSANAPEFVPGGTMWGAAKPSKKVEEAAKPSKKIEEASIEDKENAAAFCNVAYTGGAARRGFFGGA